MYLKPQMQVSKNHHPNFMDLSLANRELMLERNKLKANKMKKKLVDGLRGRIDEQMFKNFSSWVEKGNSASLLEIRKMASRYKSKYIFEKLKEDEEIQKYCKQIEMLLQER